MRPDERKLFTRGIIRALGFYDYDEKGNYSKRSDVFDNKKHRELFIPYPEEAENWPTFEIPPDVIERFHDVADQRTRSKKKGPPLPYHPAGTPRNLNPKDQDDRTFRLKDGDLVYFRPSSKTPNTIAEIALSSIWRARVDDDTGRASKAHSFFKQLDQESLPFNPDRTQITLAEQLFGFVEEKDEKKKEDEKQALALASRIYPSPARLAGVSNADETGWEADGLDAPYLCDRKNESDWIPLKILASPKPSSPSMYFKLADGSGDYISKRDLKTGSHHPQGRKLYLHRCKKDIAAPWQTSNARANSEQKAMICPIKPRAVFYFHINFDNLSELELGLLLYALRPTRKFRHKVGMGKPLGLGTVRIEPVGLFRVDRKQRYTPEGLFAPRYLEVWLADNAEAYSWADARTQEWPEHYALEKAAAGKPFSPSPPEIHKAFRDGMNEDIRHALELIGDPDNLESPVHTPLIESQSRECEEETFKWFVANDTRSGENKRPKQFLKPITAKDVKIPTLDKNPWHDK